MDQDFFSVAQMFGHATLIVSLVTFSRKKDRHFKLCLTVQNILYAIHMALMGNVAGMAAQCLSASRNVLSLRTRSIWVAFGLVVANLLLAFFVVKAVWNVIPLFAVGVATVSMFRLKGIQLRYGMFCATLLWIINNVLTGSISATLMECVIAVISLFTIARLRKESNAVAA